MVLTDKKVICVAEADEELLIFDVSDDALERIAGDTGERAITWLYSTECSANCGCPV